MLPNVLTLKNPAAPRRGRWHSLWLYCKWCMKYGGWPGGAVRIKGDYWRGMKKPICSSCVVAPWTRSWTRIDPPLLPQRLPPPPAHHQSLDGKCKAKETFITGPLWDAHSQERSLLLVRGACVDRAGAWCQYNIKPQWARDQGFAPSSVRPLSHTVFSALWNLQTVFSRVFTGASSLVTGKISF